MHRGIFFLTEEEDRFIKDYQAVIDMMRKEARLETQKYEKEARRKAQSQIGKSIFENSIDRKDLQSASGNLNIVSETYYKKCLRNRLMTIQGITEQLVEEILTLS